MNKYLVFLTGMAAQEIEAAEIRESGNLLSFYAVPAGGDQDVIASFRNDLVIGWRITEKQPVA